MPIDLVKFYLHNFYEYLQQTNLNDYEHKKDINVRENPVYFKFTIVVTINEANMHYIKHGLKQILVAYQKRWKC